MEYRKATLWDTDTLSQLRVAMHLEDDEFSKEFQELLYQNTKHYIESGLVDRSFSAWVALWDDVIVAMGGATFFTLPPNDWCPGGKTAYISSMYTLPGFRNQGIASHLLDLIIGEAKERLCQRIWLNASDMGRPLYEKHGFAGSPTAMALYPLGIQLALADFDALPNVQCD